MATINNKINLDRSQPIYLGLDIHKLNISIAVTHQNELIRKASVPANIQALTQFLKSYQGFKVESVYEAGFCGFYWHRELSRLGIKNIITPPNKLPVVVGDRVKTDIRDSVKMSTFLSRRLLRQIQVPTEELAALRQVMRTRHQLVRKKTSTLNQVKGLLYLYGITLEKGLPGKTREEIRNFDLPSPVKFTLESQLQTYEFLEKQIKLTEKECVNTIESRPEYRDGFNRLKSVPGIGDLTAAVLLYEVGCWDRFQNERQVGAFFGLTPCEYSSGERTLRGRITGQGNPWIRALLVEAAWTVIKKDPSLEKVFSRVWANSGSKKKAIVAVARKLVCRIYAMMKNGTEYRIGPAEAHSKQN